MEDNPYKAPATLKHHRHTQWFLTAFFDLAVVSGIREVYSSKPSALDLLLPIADAICLGSWAVVDSNRRGRPIPMTSRWWFILFAVIVVPGYVVWSRGWRGVAWLAVNCLAWLVLFGVTLNVVGLIALGSNWLPE